MRRLLNYFHIIFLFFIFFLNLIIVYKFNLLSYRIAHLEEVEKKFSPIMNGMVGNRNSSNDTFIEIDKKNFHLISVFLNFVYFGDDKNALLTLRKISEEYKISEFKKKHILKLFSEFTSVKVLSHQALMYDFIDISKNFIEKKDGVIKSVGSFFIQRNKKYVAKKNEKCIDQILYSLRRKDYDKVLLEMHGCDENYQRLMREWSLEVGLVSKRQAVITEILRVVIR